MIKAISAILSAAAIAGFITFILPGAPLEAGPLEKPAAETLKSCTQQAWPYLNCVGTAVGNPKIRLVTTDRIPQ